MECCEGCEGDQREARDFYCLVAASTLKSCRAYDPTMTDDRLADNLTEAVETLGELGCVLPPGAIYQQIVAQAADLELPLVPDLDLPWDELLADI